MHRIGILLVGVIFLFSGAFALVYEVTWARMLTPQFGSDAVAIAIVVSVFMLGLGVGAWLAGLWGDSFRNPLRTYGLLEMLLGLYVLVSPWMIGWFAPALTLLGHGAIENPWILNSARTLLGLVVLLPPTLIMGASLPLLARFAADVARHVPTAVIGLYAINIVGAVIGVLAAGYWLLPAMGMKSVLWLIGTANLVMGLLVVLISRSFVDAHQSRQTQSAGSESDPAEGIGLALPLAVALVGLASMACQLAWTRVIVLIVGGSVYAFSSVLAVFLAGLGLGAWLAALAVRLSGRHTLLLFSIAGAVSVVSIFISTAVLPLLPGVFLEAFDADLAATRLGIFNVQVLVAAILFLLPATCMGMLFPLILRIGLGNLRRPASATGNLYLANTIGCVAGALLAGLVLIPAIGLLATLLIAIGIIGYAVILVLSRSVAPAMQLLAVTVLVVVYGVGWFMVPPWNAQLMASGISEYARAYQSHAGPELGDRLAHQAELLFYRDGHTATVSVSRDLSTLRRDLYISTNGKVDGSSYSDMPTQKLSAHLPLLLHANPRKVAVIGMGTGVTAGSATLHEEVERVVVLEIEPAMVEGSRLFADFNQGVHNHPRSDIRVTDGRLHLILAKNTYDVVTTEPSNPWIAGIANLYTEEFYRLGAAALREGGVYAQWLQVYNMSPDNVRAVIRTFAEVFPYTYVAVTIVDTDLLLIGSKQALKLDLETMASRLFHPPVATDLADPPIGVHSLHELLARLWLVPEDIPGLIEGARLHRDDRPFLMYEAPLDRYIGNRRLNTLMVAESASGLLPALEASHQAVDDEHLQHLRRAYADFVPKPLHWWAEQ